VSRKKQIPRYARDDIFRDLWNALGMTFLWRRENRGQSKTKPSREF